MIKVKLYKGNVAGDVAHNALDAHPDVQVVEVITPTDHAHLAGYDGEFDILFSASFPKRISQEECAKAKIGAVNIHTGLLPQQRGIAPLNWALIWGDNATGVTIHKIVDTFDGGDVVLQEVVKITQMDNIRTLKERCLRRFPLLIHKFFNDPQHWLDRAWQQNQAEATYAQARRPEDSELCPSAPGEDIFNHFRACDPEEYPAYVLQEDGTKRYVKNVSPDGEIEYV